MFGINDLLHAVAQGLLVPSMLILLMLLVFTVVSIGSLAVEAITERRHFKANTPSDVKSIHEASFGSIETVIRSTSLIKDQKEALLVIARNMELPDGELFSLAKAELARIDAPHQRSVKRTELITKIGPMMGLICTLIPLGPGIVALGQGAVDQLSQSLLVAFDGTVAGLISAVVAMCITNVRKRWYKQYAVAMEALMSTILDKAEQLREDGVEISAVASDSAQPTMRRDPAAKAPSVPTFEGR